MRDTPKGSSHGDLTAKNAQGAERPSTGTYYHYTARRHLPAIIASGRLTLTESNIGSASPHLKPHGEHVGPDVVWLTEDGDLSRGHGLDLGAVNKLAIRFTVEVDATHWPRFAAGHGINKNWYRALNRTGGNAARKWLVCLTEIPVSAWREVRDMEHNVVLYRDESGLEVAS